MSVSHVVLGLGTFAAIGSYAAAGRIAALIITALWSGATAYLFMEPAYSLRVSNPSDLVALALYGAFGVVLARTPPKNRRLSRADARGPVPLPAPQADLATIFTELMSASPMGADWKRSGISVHASRLEEFRCSHTDGALVLSRILSAILTEPETRHVSLHVARRPMESLLFIDVFRVGMPALKTISMAESTEECSCSDSAEWPRHWKASRFEYPWGAIYRVSLDRNQDELTRPKSNCRPIRSRISC